MKQINVVVIPFDGDYGVEWRASGVEVNCWGWGDTPDRAIANFQRRLDSLRQERAATGPSPDEWRSPDRTIGDLSIWIEKE